ncbi:MULTISPECIES: hypothetical protein [Planktothricoides]|uniref:Uncharacterized protein n=1 Tax=Planktothricoides raciborskii FACHB-1370 TaxID=2949576 RepID=A0ABR8EAV8_9CYAN|nr:MULTISPECIES: hypothetical protein [Planktothricoides]MBD2543896.1 hypothetical protein [Planktothricoides raciborskii FACHB-1370]MBD2582884.1 hypothetical protein [Planktothricoides raciborskii FACHB-1261]
MSSDGINSDFFHILLIFALTLTKTMAGIANLPDGLMDFSGKNSQKNSVI